MYMILSDWEIQEIYILIEKSDNVEEKRELQTMLDRSYDLKFDYSGRYERD